jgi:hypothetical protein
VPDFYYIADSRAFSPPPPGFPARVQPRGMAGDEHVDAGSSTQVSDGNPAETGREGAEAGAALKWDGGVMGLAKRAALPYYWPCLLFAREVRPRDSNLSPPRRDEGFDRLASKRYLLVGSFEGFQPESEHSLIPCCVRQVPEEICDGPVPAPGDPAHERLALFMGTWQIEVRPRRFEYTHVCRYV